MFLNMKKKGEYIMNNEIFMKKDFTKEDLILIRGCLLTTRETFKCIPFKNQDIKNKIKKIDNLLLKFSEKQ